MDGVDKAFEARVTAKLEQQKAEIRALQVMATGTLLAVALVGVAIALLGKELGKGLPQ